VNHHVHHHAHIEAAKAHGTDPVHLNKPRGDVHLSDGPHRRIEPLRVTNAQHGTGAFRNAAQTFGLIDRRREGFFHQARDAALKQRAGAFHVIFRWNRNGHRGEVGLGRQ
jgi:hypothetical protein